MVVTYTKVYKSNKARNKDLMDVIATIELVPHEVHMSLSLNDLAILIEKLRAESEINIEKTKVYSKTEFEIKENDINGL